jgi:signal recognition particle subunit SRP54
MIISHLSKCPDISNTAANSRAVVPYFWQLVRSLQQLFALAAYVVRESRMRVSAGFVAAQGFPGRNFQIRSGSLCAGRPLVIAPRLRRPLTAAPLKRHGLSPPLRMMFDALAGKMSETVRKMRGVDKITEKNVKGAMKEIRRALLDADVNLRVVNNFIQVVQERAIGEKVLPNVEPGQMLVKIVHEELARVMGSDLSPLASRPTGKGPTVVLMAGLQGAGKTTAAAKLALHCKKEKRSVLMVACDVYRPAAIEQLRTLGDQIEVEVFSMGTDVDPRQIARAGIERAVELGMHTVIVDTAGRQVVDGKLMKELQDIKRITQADETLLVVDAMSGQEAATLTEAFNEQIGITGAILTKLDGDSRGGAALSVQQVSGKPIKFIGTGEKLERLEPFFPERMASRILGMGDILTLVEKAQEEMSLAEAEKMTRKMMEAKFDFDDFLKQTKAISAMGSLGGLVKMMPGMGNVSESKLAEASAKLKVADSLIKSMTSGERSRPELLFAEISSRSRLTRIAKGSGRSVRDAENLISDFQQMRTMMQRMSKQMMNGGNAGPGGAPGMPASPGSQGGASNRAQRRKATKKNSGKERPKRGFG